MPVLENAKHEQFAQAIARGETAVDAYENLGYKRNHGNAVRLKNSEKMRRRIAEILEHTAKRVEGRIATSAEETLNEAARIAFSDIRNLFDEEGNLKPVHELDTNTARAIRKVKVTTKPGAKDAPPIHVTEIEFWNKMDALGKLGQHFEIFGGGDTGKDPLQVFADLLFQAAARPLPLADPATPALAAQAAQQPLQRRSSAPIEDARIVNPSHEEVEP